MHFLRIPGDIYRLMNGIHRGHSRRWMSRVSVKNALCDDFNTWYNFTDITCCFTDITCCIWIQLEVMFRIQYLLVKSQRQLSTGLRRPCNKNLYRSFLCKINHAWTMLDVLFRKKEKKLIIIWQQLNSHSVELNTLVAHRFIVEISLLFSE